MKFFAIKITATLFIVLFAFIVIFPVFAEAATPPIVFCGRGSAANPIGEACTLCDLLTLVKNMIDFVVYQLAPVVATILILFSGIMIMLNVQIPVAGEKTGYAAGTRMLKGTISALILIYCAWLITNTFIQIVAGSSNTATSWFKLECTNPEFRDQLKPTPDILPGTGGTLSSDAARLQLQQANIGSKRECGPGESKGCAKLDTVRQSAINDVVSLKNRCKLCSIFVTAGAEPGHTGTGSGTHAGGDKIDLDETGSLSNFIRTSSDFTRKDRKKKDGTIEEGYVDSKTGAWYVLEDPGTQNGHWDMLTGGRNNTAPSLPVSFSGRILKS